ncbi:MAG TPA: ferritin-like domain-containing protein [Nocardioidaceae bacterium]|nr:ferritin-like domain-containing protein [Nocardioidaceae bacterium]
MTPLQALQHTLAGEHAAVYVYGVIGARVSVSQQPDLWQRVGEAYDLHRDRRDNLTAMVRAAGADPVAAEVSYELPNEARTPGQLQQAALETEQRCAAVYADMVGSTSGANRQWALDALEDASVRLLGFGGQAEPFPGVGEL